MTTPYETFEVEMHAFQNGVIREVRVPEDRLTGDLDQDRYRGARYRVAPVGFELIA